MLPMLALGLGSAGTSLAGSLMSRQKGPNWGNIGSQYLNQLGGAYSNQYMGNYDRLGDLTMGQGNAAGYSDAALSAFRKSGAYQSMLQQLGAGAANQSNAIRGNAAQGMNFGVGNAAYNAANPGSIMNNALQQAIFQQYLAAQQQFAPLAGLRMQGANQMSQGGLDLTRQAMGQYRQTPSFMNALGGGLMGLGNAGMQYAMMGAGGGNGLGSPGWNQTVSNAAGGWGRPDLGLRP